MRAPAPPYAGEGPRALWHVSEDPTIKAFAPHRARTALTDELRVWAVDTRHLPLFWYPRDCPRCTFWAGPRTTDDDADRFLEGHRDRRVHVVEGRWIERIERARLYLYRMPDETFREDDEVAGEANLWPLWDEVVASSLEYSGIRLRNAQPRQTAR